MDSTTSARRLTQRLHVHCARSMACASGIPNRKIDLTHYSERSLLFAKSGDLVCLHDAPDPKYLAYLNGLGIGPKRSDVIVCPDTAGSAELPLSAKLAEDPLAWRLLLDRLQQVDDVVLQPYMTTRYEHDLAQRLRDQLQGTVQLMGGDCDVIEQVDQKHQAREVAIQLGIPVAPGEVIELATTVDWFRFGDVIRRQLPHTRQVIIRGTSGNGGSSVEIVSRPDDVTSCVARLRATDPNRVFLVEALLDVTSSPNVGMFIDPRTRDITCFSRTKQVMSGLSHSGNRHPLKNSDQLPAMISAAERFAAYLRDRGVTGHLGFDFCEYQTQAGESSFVLAEINPRLNGATYYQSLFNALNQVQQIRGGPSLNAFQAVILPTTLGRFTDLESSFGAMLFQPGVEQGVVPVNLTFLTHGKCGMVIVAEKADVLDELYNRVSAKLRPAFRRQAA